LTLIFALCFFVNASAQTDRTSIMFWNLENFFEPGAGGAPKYWTAKRYYSKCDGIAKTILKLSEQSGELPDIICFAEVENRKVLKDLISSTVLRKLDYRIVHYDSEDHRGIDCALLYRKGTMNLLESKPCPIYDKQGIKLPTRDILLCRFEGLDVMVNHHPSKLGSGAADNRKLAMERMNFLADSLICSGSQGVLAIGDFNDNLWPQKKGTIKFNGIWERIDGIFLWGKTKVQEQDLDYDFLLEKDKRYGGLKPRRTFVGPRYNGGLSDHLPIFYYIYVLS